MSISNISNMLQYCNISLKEKHLSADMLRRFQQQIEKALLELRFGSSFIIKII